MKSKGLVIVISGPSGVGKTTLHKKLKQNSLNSKYSVSVTTRPPRTNEINGNDYFFATEKEFKKMIKNNEFLEWAVVHNYYYGTPSKFVKETLSRGKNVILEIDVQGARRIKKLYRNKSVLIFILPPSIDTLKTRLYGRGKDNRKTIELRLKNAKKELGYITDFDYLVINDNLETAVKKIKNIINTVRQKKIN